MKSKFIIALIALLIYVVSTFASYAFFSAKSSTSLSSVTPNTDDTNVSNDFEAIVFDSAKPKTEECPLNGAKYSKEQREWWEQHRPLGIMIENHIEARPQSGLIFADIIYEAIAEGGITRFLAVYYCQDAGIVGPVRSARTYFLDWISEYGLYPLYAHVGGANTPGPANALGQIIDYGWNMYNDLNQFSIGYPTFRRDESRLGRQVATEHTMYSTTSRLWDVGKKRGLTYKDKDGQLWNKTFTAYTFKDDDPVAERGNIRNIHLEFWEGYGDYAVDWVYNREKNLYLRQYAGKPHLDRNTNQQLFARNLVVLRMIESSANDGYEGNAHRLYRNKGTGEAIVFQDGKQIKARWKKGSREDRTIITDLSGKEIAFNRGVIWFAIVPVDEGIVDAK